MYWAAREADRSLQPGDVSVTTWMGYDRPMNLINDAPSTSYAHNGAGALESHNEGAAGPSINTVIGYSHGSTLVGAAGLDGHHRDANNVVAVGSPGMLANQADDLRLAPGAHVFATRAENDLIGIATHAALGPDPMSRQFGGIPFEAAPGPPTGSARHGASLSAGHAGRPPDGRAWTVAQRPPSEPMRMPQGGPQTPLLTSVKRRRTQIDLFNP